MPNDNTKKWLHLHLTQEVGSITFARLLDYFGNIDDILAATEGQLQSIPRIGAKTARSIVTSRDSIDVDEELELAEQLGVKILTLESDNYPQLLRQIHDPPPVLYVKGELTRADHLAVAVVGARNCSHYGQEQASRLSHLLAGAGFTIVSGLARGIDTAAHRGALAGGGRTIAVQGCGLAHVFPTENKDLAERIVAQGALLSELPLRYEPLGGTFPARNRIISGLSLASIIVEARRGSGALITSTAALDQNREVMAVPGQIDSPLSDGPLRLIKDGATLVRGIEDILDALGHVGAIVHDHATESADATTKKVEPTLFDTSQLKLTVTESAVLAALDHAPLHIDQIITRAELPVGPTNAALTSLQLKGAVKQLPGSLYQKR